MDLTDAAAYHGETYTHRETPTHGNYRGVLDTAFLCALAEEPGDDLEPDPEPDTYRFLDSPDIGAFNEERLAYRDRLENHGVETVVRESPHPNAVYSADMYFGFDGNLYLSRMASAVRRTEELASFAFAHEQGCDPVVSLRVRRALREFEGRQARPVARESEYAVYTADVVSFNTEVVWEDEINVRGVLSGQAAATDELYLTGLSTGYMEGSIVAFDIETGDRRWEFDVDGSIAHVFADETVYIAADSLSAVDAETGFEQWRVPLTDDVLDASLTAETFYVTMDGDEYDAITAIDR